tara:strand:- start:79 stop:1794 length:1716 start_codon:yes stop_codon:yes gene_type:complete
MKAIEHVKRIEKECNATCLSKDIKNIKEKLNWICKDGHEFPKSIEKINQYLFCTKCSRKEKREKERIKFYAFIKSQEKKYDLTLISKEYFDNKKHLEWKCKNNHLFPARWANIQTGHGCPYCSGNKPLVPHTKTAKKLASERGGKLLSKEIYRTHEPYMWECSKGHQWQATYTSVKDRGAWCSWCAHGEPINLKSMRKIAGDRGGKCIKYIKKKHGHKHFLFECSEGHQWNGNANHIRRGSWCKECSSGLGERILREYFQQYFNKDFPNVRPNWLKNPKTNRNLELDGFNEELKIAFEHQGYQHYQKHYTNQRLDKQIYKDKIKEKVCKERGILLFIIPEIPRLTPLDELDDMVQDILLRNNFIKKRRELSIDFSNAYKNTHFKNQYLRLKEIVSKKNGKLLEKEFLGVKELHKIKCENLHIFEQTPDRIWNTDKWCSYCSGQKRLEPLLDELKRHANKMDGKLLSPSVRIKKQKVLWKCKLGHEWEASYETVIRQSKWCGVCEGRMQPVNLKRAKDLAKKYNGDCIKFVCSVNDNNHKIFLWKCDKGHEWEDRFHTVARNSWCKKCKIEL